MTAVAVTLTAVAVTLTAVAAQLLLLLLADDRSCGSVTRWLHFLCETLICSVLASRLGDCVLTWRVTNKSRVSCTRALTRNTCMHKRNNKSWNYNKKGRDAKQNKYTKSKKTITIKHDCMAKR